jgi:N-acetylglucosamine-6-sulfatase
VIRKAVPALIAFMSVIAAVAGCDPSPARGHRGGAAPSRPPVSAPSRPPVSAPSQRPVSRPDFVFVLTDDLSWNLVSHMPHVRALERAGVTMSRYYVVDSLCCPSRAAIFTGEYPHDDGVFTNAGSDGGYRVYNKNGNPPKSFAVALQQAGYRTAMMGKYLNGYLPQDRKAPGWNQWDVANNGYPEYNYSLNENGTIRHYGHQPKDYLTDVLSAKAGSFIDFAAAAGRPFMLEVAPFAPHRPYTPPPNYLNAAATAAYPTTRAYNRLPAHPPSWLKGRPPLTAEDKRRITVVYRKRVEDDLAVDDLIGHLEARLHADGVARNTYFIFSSDNGYHMGEYRLMPGKQTAFDTDIHVPLIVTGPGVPAGHVISELASNIDLNPTFEKLAGLRVPADVDGHSLAGLWHGRRPANWRRSILIEHHGPDHNRHDPDRQSAASADPPSYEAVRTVNALYVRYANGKQEYYDTARDPLELDNIAASGVPESLKKALKALENCHSGATCWAAAHLH